MTAQPLSRRDRAACVLAYENLRAMAIDSPMSAVLDAQEALVSVRPPSFATNMSRAVDVAWAASSRVRHHRVLRARLALLLRAVLRADAGDYGREGMICTKCGAERGHEHCACCVSRQGRDFCSCWGAWRDGYARITPLWELAAARKAAR